VNFDAGRPLPFSLGRLVAKSSTFIPVDKFIETIWYITSFFLRVLLADCSLRRGFSSDNHRTPVLAHGCVYLAA